MKLLFLGGTSYLGKEIIRRLNEKGQFEISAYLRNEQSASKLEEIEVITYTDLAQIPEQDIVFNLVVDYGKDKTLEEVISVNVDYPLNLLSKLKFKTVINFSTALDKNVSFYSTSKKLLEDHLVTLGGQRHFRVINLQLQHFYGPGAPIHNFVSFIINKMLKNEELNLTDCLQERDFLYVHDLIEAVQVLILKVNELPSNLSIEVGSGVSIRLKDFVEKIKAICRSHSVVHYGAVARRANEPERLVSDNTTINQLGWVPRTSLDDGLSKTIAFYQGNQNR